MHFQVLICIQSVKRGILCILYKHNVFSFLSMGYFFMNKLTLEQYLKELRKSCGYSQEFVASHLNITRQTYSHYETGRITPPVNSLYNLAKLYGVPVENFLDLVVTYTINMDFALKQQTGNMENNDDLNLFLEFTGTPTMKKKFKFLDRRERLLLFYYLQLERRDQDDILDFLKVKFHRQQREALSGKEDKSEK